MKSLLWQYNIGNFLLKCTRCTLQALLEAVVKCQTNNLLYVGAEHSTAGLHWAVSHDSYSLTSYAVKNPTPHALKMQKYKDKQQILRIISTTVHNKTINVGGQCPLHCHRCKTVT